MPGARQPLTSRGKAEISFHDPASAAPILARVTPRISAELAAALPALLAESPDPDSSLLLFERLLTETSGEVVRLVERNHALAHYAIAVFGHSRFLGETLIRNTDLLQLLLREKHLDRSFPREEFRESLARFRSRSLEHDIALLLARFKRREYVRIMLRDVLRIATLAETTAEISALADVLIEEALREASSALRNRFGTPQHLGPHGRRVETPFAILALGKLGGNELNYSSDVDLVFLYGDGEEPAKAPVSNREFFVRLAQQVTDILSRVTQEGPVFRIDLRLRPQGGQGEMAVSLTEALRYYSEAAHDWELQALIKARHSAGDLALAREFIRGVQPRVYTPHINLEAIETVLVARGRMQARRHRMTPVESSTRIDVKLDRGGIRDIEFLVQCLQRVYGGAEPWLRSGGTLFSLQKLHDKGHISAAEFHELTCGYEFLRHLEHRLQLRQGQQTHRLPAAPHDLRILQLSLPRDESAGDALNPRLARTMNVVAEVYERIIHQQRAHPDYRPAERGFQLRSRAEPSPGQHSDTQILERLAEDAPALYHIACSEELSSAGRRNLFRFLSSAFTSSERYAAVLRHPEALKPALQVLETSQYLADILIRHPEEIATLAELADSEPAVGVGYLFRGAGQPASNSDAMFSYLANAPVSYGEKLAWLRNHYRHRVFASGARDVALQRDVYASLAATSAAAEDAIAAAYAFVGAPEGLAVMALGRLGTGEFDVLSDADLLFVYDEGYDRIALTRTAEQWMQALAAYTRDGMLFPVDARLRPRGAEGELLVSPAQLAVYLEQEAQAWEALTYTKMRFLAGSQVLGQRAMAATEPLFRRFGSDPSFAGRTREMRLKMETAESSFKTSPGAIYDIDFLAAYLLVKYHAAGRGTLRDRLWQCAEAGWLGRGDAAALDHAAEFLRTLEHLTRLVVGRTYKWLPSAEQALRITTELASRILRRSFPDGLDAELTQTFGEVRGVYEKVLR